MSEEIDLAAIEGRAAAATPGPWEDDWPCIYAGRGREVVDDHQMADGDRAFIAAAREDVPALCLALREARSEIARLRADLEGAGGHA